MALNLIFGNISAIEHKEEYVKEKLQHFYGTTLNLELNTHSILRNHSTMTLPIIEAKNLPSVNNDEQTALRASMLCFKKDVLQALKMAPNEKITIDFITYLHADFREFGQGTPVMVVQTNLATLYLIENSFRIHNKTLTNINQHKLNDQPTVRPMMAAGATNILVTFAQSIISAAGEKIGTSILDAVFGTSGGLNLLELQQNIAEIVKNANIDQTIQENGGSINGILTDVKNGYYKTRKTSGASKKELYDYLLVKQSKLVEIIGVLNQEMFAIKAIPTFIAAVNLLVTVLEEMCTQDPLVEQAGASSNLNLIKVDLGIYAKQLKETRERAFNERIGHISPVRDNPWSDGYVCASRYYFEDSFTGKSSGHFEQNGTKDNPQERAKSYRQEKINGINDSMKWIDDVVAAWEKGNTITL